MYAKLALLVFFLHAIGSLDALTFFKKHRIHGRQLESTFECIEGYIKCANVDKCIQPSWLCDGDNDCGDDSDEPSTCPPLTCSDGYMKCPTRNRCKPLSFFCDGDNDCIDNSDEPEDCKTRSCPEGTLKCNSGQCINKIQFCQGNERCRDGTQLDDRVCPSVTCEEGYAKCPGVPKCIRMSYFCDGDNDCGNNADEPASCKSGPAAPQEQQPDISPELMICALKMQQLKTTCGEFPFVGDFLETNPANIYQNFAQMQLAQICSPVLPWYNCIRNEISYCETIDEPMIKSALSYMKLGGVALNYVCVEHVDVIGRHKSCLMKESDEQETPQGEDQLPALAMSVAGSCGGLLMLQDLQEQPMCITQALRACVKNAVAGQCGDEIASTLDGLVERIRTEANCPSERKRGLPAHHYKRRGIPTFAKIVRSLKSFF